MKVWNFGASQSIGYDHDSLYINKPQCTPYKIKETAYPWLLASNVNCDLINYAVPGFNYERIYHTVINALNKIQTDDIVLLQLNTGFVTPQYFTPDGDSYHLYSPQAVIDHVPTKWQDIATAFYLEHQSLHGDWYKFMLQTIMISKLLSHHNINPIYIICDIDYPDSFIKSSFNDDHAVDIFELYKNLLLTHSAIRMKAIADNIGFTYDGRHYDAETHQHVLQSILDHKYISN